MMGGLSHSERIKHRIITLVSNLLLLAVALPGVPRHRFQAAITLQDANIVDRLTIWRSALAMTADHPITGVGVGTFRLAYDESYGAPLHASYASVHAHNLYLHVLAEMGVLGFLGLLWLIFSAARWAWRHVRSSQASRSRAVAAGVLSAGVVFLIESLFESSFTGFVSDMSCIHINLVLAVSLSLLPGTIPMPSSAAKQSVALPG